MPGLLKNILLVDDMKSDNFLTTRIIKKANAADSITVKRDGREALDYLNGKETGVRNHPELVLLDINMPGMNGWEFLEAFTRLPREQQDNILICILTTSDLAEDRERAGAYPFVGTFCSKPLSEQQLLEAVALAEMGR